MFAFLKKICGCDDSKETLEERREAAYRQDREIRESLTEKQIDKELKDTMEASDPVAKY